MLKGMPGEKFERGNLNHFTRFISRINDCCWRDLVKITNKMTLQMIAFTNKLDQGIDYYLITGGSVFF
jgi:hypothetical protein